MDPLLITVPLGLRNSQMSHTPYRGIIWGTIIGDSEGDTRSVDYGSYDLGSSSGWGFAYLGFTFDSAHKVAVRGLELGYYMCKAVYVCIDIYIDICVCMYTYMYTTHPPPAPCLEPNSPPVRVYGLRYNGGL